MPERVLTVAFGPSSSRRVALALSRARRLRVDLREIAPGRHQATFRLTDDQCAFAAAWALLSEVRFVAGTEVEVDGEPETGWEASAMAHCARDWLRAVGACFEPFPGRPWSKCFLCPLLDPARLSMSEGGGMLVPDYVPPEWIKDEP